MKVSAPVTVPTSVGKNVTPTVQLAPAATLPPHVLLATAKGPLVATPVKLSATFRRFVKVTVRTPLVLPTVKVPKLTRVDDKPTGALPVPLSPTI